MCVSLAGQRFRPQKLARMREMALLAQQLTLGEFRVDPIPRPGPNVVGGFLIGVPVVPFEVLRATTRLTHSTPIADRTSATLLHPPALVPELLGRVRVWHRCLRRRDEGG